MEEQFEKLVNQYKNLVFSICLKMTGDYFAAEDLTQETFLSAYQHMSEFHGEQWKAWLARIATNQSIDYLRQAARRSIPVEEETFATEVSREDDPLTQFLNTETMEEMEQQCQRLKEPYREVAIWYYCENKTMEEIVLLTGKNKKTIQSQVYRARDLLRKMYRKERGCLEAV